MRDNPRICQIMQVALKAGLLALALALSGCVTAPAYTSQDVAKAAQQGQLEPLFNQVKAELDKANPDSDKALALDTVLRDIAQRLAKPHQAAIDDLLSKARKGTLSMAQVKQLETEVATVKQWLPYDNVELRQDVAAARKHTEEQLRAVNADLGALTPDQVGQRYVLTLELADLTGGAEGKAMATKVATAVENDYQQGVAAVENKQLSAAQDLLRRVDAVDPEYKDLVFQRELVATGLFEQNFWQALVDGRPDEAYTLFHDFAQSSAFATHRDKIAKDASELAEYFDALGDKKRQQKQWLESYRGFKKAAYIRQALELDQVPSTGLQRFTREMENRFNRAEQAGKIPAAVAYLSVIDRLSPQHPLLERKQRAGFDTVFDQAVVKVSVEPFAGSYGRQMASAISRHLLAAVPNEVRIVSRDQFQMLIDNQQQSQAYFMVEGEMLRTDIEKQELPRSEKRRVATASKPGPNPLYKAWRDLPRSERATTEEPPEITELPVYQDVIVRHHDVTNKAVLSVSYKVVDPVTAKVLFVETVSDTLSAEATTTEGMVVGDFVLEAVPARLPSEAEMFEQLTHSVSELIGSELADRLLALESRYETAARDQEEQNNYSAAVDQWVYAYIVSEPESEQQALYRLSMEEAVLRI